jgi:hypothetical protein
MHRPISPQLWPSTARSQSRPLFGLMLAAQAIEFLWVVLTYPGIEHQPVDPNGYLHLDYLLQG